MRPPPLPPVFPASSAPRRARRHCGFDRGDGFFPRLPLLPLLRHVCGLASLPGGAAGLRAPAGRSRTSSRNSTRATYWSSRGAGGRGPKRRRRRRGRVPGGRGPGRGARNFGARRRRPKARRRCRQTDAVVARRTKASAPSKKGAFKVRETTARRPRRRAIDAKAEPITTSSSEPRYLATSPWIPGRDSQRHPSAPGRPMPALPLRSA